MTTENLPKMSINRLFSSIAAVAAGITLAANLLQAGSAQAGVFYDFDILWNDSTTTKGWLEVNDTPDFQNFYDDGYNKYDYKYWGNILDASFTHEGTSYGKSDLIYHDLFTHNFADSVYQFSYGNKYNYLTMGGFGNNSLYGGDFNAGSNSPVILQDYAYKYGANGDYSGYAMSFSLVERSAKAVPEPASITALLGFGVLGAGSLLKRKQQQKATAKA